MSTFGERLKQLRIEKGLTLDQLKDQLETTKATLSRYENDKRDPKIEFANKAATFFGVSTDYILGVSDERKNISIKTQKIKEILNCFAEYGYDPNEVTKEDFKAVLNAYMTLKGLKKD